MIITVKSPKGTEIKIDLAANTVTIGSMVDCQIQGWGVTNYEGKNVTIVKADGKNIVIDHTCGKAVYEAKKTFAAKKLESAVPGVTLLRAAMEGEAAYFEAMQAMMEDEMNDGVNPPKKTALDTDALRAQYPRAAAYLQAESYESASNYRKSDAGTKAKKLLENGGDIEEAKLIMKNWLGDSNID